MSNHKGFTLIEMLLVLSILSIGMMAVLPRFKNLTRPSSFSSDILSQQLNAMVLAQQHCSDYLPQICFNAFGNINQAGTYRLGGRTYIFQLGFGRFRYE